MLASLFAAPPSHAQDGALPTADFSSLNEDSVRTVTDIIDPLTVTLDDGRTIHLAGIDYPDLDYYDPGELSQTAIKILDDFLKGKKVIIYNTKNPADGRVNRMGHEIAQLERKDDGVWVQGMLLTLGLARVRTDRTNPEMAEQMYDIEQKARDAKTGLWEVDAYKILPADDAEMSIGSYAVIEGKIVTAAMKSNKLYLNFGQNWRSDFTVAIDTQSRRAFRKEGFDPIQWGGKNVRVRGWVSSFNGPYMEIDHPERFEILPDDAPPPEARNETPNVPEEEKINNDKPPASDILNRKGNALPSYNND
ncbi:MAG: thermonuclease family protein [Alphaproteobacteria bacterium]|nr:thermonuclease family protein [Alphaproteobacteria bacterium]